MSQPPDDFFAPRLKLSWNMRLIRVAAFLMAVCIALWFLLINFEIWRDQKPSALIFLIGTTAFQLILLLPCWRAWLLHRWAGPFPCCLLFPFCCLVVLCSNVTLPGAADIWLAAITLILTLLSVQALISEWPNLKSGF